VVGLGVMGGNLALNMERNGSALRATIWTRQGRGWAAALPQASA